MAWCLANGVAVAVHLGLLSGEQFQQQEAHEQ